MKCNTFTILPAFVVVGFGMLCNFVVDRESE